MCLRCFIHRSNCPPNNNIYPAVSVSLCQRRKSHPSIHLHVAVDRSFWRKYSPRYRVISRTRCTQTVTRLQIRFRTPILPSELLVSRRGKEREYACSRAYLSRALLLAVLSVIGSNCLASSTRITFAVCILRNR